MFDEKHEINKITWISSVQNFLFRKKLNLPKICEILQSFAKISPHAKSQRSQTTKLCHFVNFMTCPNIILIEKKWEKKIIYRFICKWWPLCVRTSLLWNVGWERILRQVDEWILINYWWRVGNPYGKVVQSQGVISLWNNLKVSRQQPVLASTIHLCQAKYSVMQSDGNSLKIDTFREAITSELMILS